MSTAPEPRTPSMRCSCCQRGGVRVYRTTAPLAAGGLLDEVTVVAICPVCDGGAAHVRHQALLDEHTDTDDAPEPEPVLHEAACPRRLTVGPACACPPAR